MPTPHDGPATTLIVDSKAQLDPARLSRWRASDMPPRYHLYWDAGLLFVLFAALMIAGRRWRFSLRTMLIVMTLAAVLLGIMSYAARKQF